MTLLAEQHGISAPSFPVIYVCGHVISGYRTDASTGRQIEELLIKASVEEVTDDAGKRRPERRESNRAQTQLPVTSKNSWLVTRASGEQSRTLASGRLPQKWRLLSKLERVARRIPSRTCPRLTVKMTPRKRPMKLHRNRLRASICLGLAAFAFATWAYRRSRCSSD